MLERKIRTYFAKLTWSYEVDRASQLSLPKGTVVRIDEDESGRRSYINYYNPKDGMLYSDDMVPFGDFEELDINYHEVFREGEDITKVLKRLNGE